VSTITKYRYQVRVSRKKLWPKERRRMIGFLRKCNQHYSTVIIEGIASVSVGPLKH